MLAQTFDNIVAACVGFVSAIFFARGTLLMTQKEIHEVTASGWGGYNQGMADSLSKQRGDYFAGALLLVFSFCLQIIANLIPASLQIVILSPLNYATSLFLVLIVCLCATFIGLVIRNIYFRARVPNSQPTDQVK